MQKKPLTHSFILLLLVTGGLTCSKAGGTAPDEDHHIDQSDNTEPIINVLKPVNDQAYNNGDTIFVQGNVTDNKLLYKGKIRITDDGSGAVVKEQTYETHILQSINFDIFYKPNVTALTHYSILVEFEDHGLNTSRKTLKVKVNP